MIDFIFFSMVAIGLSTLLFFELVQIPIKSAGSFASQNAGAANFSLKALFFNRIGAALYFPSLSYLIEKKHGFIEISFLLLGGVFVCLALLCFVLINYTKFVKYLITYLFNKRAKIDFKNTPFDAIILWSASASFFGLAGLTIPYVLSIFFFDYRLTLSNFAFVFNSIFTIIVVFIIDKKLSALLDKDCNAAFNLSRTILLGRTIGFVIFIVLYLFFISMTLA